MDTMKYTSAEFWITPIFTDTEAIKYDIWKQNFFETGNNAWASLTSGFECGYLNVRASRNCYPGPWGLNRVMDRAITVNPLAPGRRDCNYKCVSFEPIIVIDILSIFC